MTAKDYVDKLRQDGMRNFIRYGIACFKKDCKVVVLSLIHISEPTRP